MKVPSHVKRNIQNLKEEIISGEFSAESSRPVLGKSFGGWPRRVDDANAAVAGDRPNQFFA
jgi:hypothetical protein